MLFVGTSGWAYPEWKPGFYPAEVKRSAFLSHYASRLSACEINNTFYKLVDDHVIKGWASDVPDGFQFAVKAHRALTHGKSIAPVDARGDLLRDYLARVNGFGTKLGPVLFQLPPYRKLDLPALESLLAALPRVLTFAFEFRDPSWDIPEVAESIAEAGGTVCVGDVLGNAPDALPPGRIAYVRMRANKYATRRRSAWRKLLEKEASERDVYVFSKHEGVPAGDPFAGVGLAVWLERYARREGT